MKPGKVYVKKVASKPFLQLAWIDPESGFERRRSAKTNRHRDASKAADALELELFRGVPVDGIGWNDFCDRYSEEHVATLKVKSQSDWPTVMASITGIVDPRSLNDLTASAISGYAAKLRSRGKSKGVVTRYLRTLRAALRWAEHMRFVHEAPYIVLPRSAKKSKKTMKGRPITTEEFERMIKAVPAGLACRILKSLPAAVDQKAIIESWRHLLWGYWLSGIRLGEATEFYWDRQDKLCIQGIDRQRPLLLIHEELEKGNEDRLYPLTPDFVAFLRKTPKGERKGRVFEPLTRDGVTSSRVTIGRTISAIGKAANVLVNTDAKTGTKKYASAHDLRRSFGTRWAPLVQAPLLQQLMRHKSLSTTMKYYVELRATETADTLWEAHKHETRRTSKSRSISRQS